MIAAAAVLLLLVPPISESSPSGRNAAADAVADRSLPLGIDFNEKAPKADHPAAADVEALTSAGFGRWLDDQIQADDEAVGPAPAALRAYLRDRDAALWSVVGALEKDAPEWEEASPTSGDLGPILPIIRLEKLLIAAAVFEEREGDPFLASRALEASWSLARSLSVSPKLIHQLVALAVEKWEAGAIRKIREPGLQWQARLAGDEVWDRMLEAVAGDFFARGEPRDPWSDVGGKGIKAIVDSVRKASRCDVLAMSDEEFLRPAADALAVETSEERRAIRDLILENFLTNITNGIRRAARVSIDREFTLRILELRLAKSGSPDSAWPKTLADRFSVVCPGVEYDYREEKGGMRIRFTGSAPAPSMGSVLPLEFRAQEKAVAPAPFMTPTPNAAPPLTPTAAGGMMPAR